MYAKVPTSECWRVTGKAPLGIRWVDINKGDEFDQELRSRLVAKEIKRDKEAYTVFEYNNVNSLIIGDILLKATGKKSDVLLKERVLDPIGTKNYTLWRDAAENVLSYCCIDMSARDYSRFGLLFSRNGDWNGQQIVPYDFVQETYNPRWTTPSYHADMNSRDLWSALVVF